MSFDWAEYLSVAESVCGQLVSGPPAGGEARQRAAVSRAYYSAFVSARNRLRDIDHIRIPTSGQAHRIVSSQFKNATDPRRVRIGLQLDRLKAARTMCDYDDVVGQLPGLTRISLVRAARILADLGHL